MKSMSSKTNKKVVKSSSLEKKNKQKNKRISNPASKTTVKKQATAIEKVKRFVREKFKKKPDIDPEKLEKDSVIEQEDDKKIKKNQKSGDAAISFFYTNDKFVNQFEDKEIIADIQKKYPTFLLTKTDSEAKQIIIALISDKPFVTQLLDYYNITILDFFKLIFRTEMTVFKGAFLTRMSKIVNEADYSKQMRVK